MCEKSQPFWSKDILVSQMIYAILYDYFFIAEVQNSTKVWISHSEYTISK
jgi:antibiotic biosynthesis monooxygenase (ABM) superfamily enzyme